MRRQTKARQQIGVETVVLKALALVAQARQGKKAPDPVGPGHGTGLVEEGAGAHGQQMLHGQVLEQAAAHRPALVGEEVGHGVLGGQQAVVHGAAHGQRGDALAGREGMPGRDRIPGTEGGLAEDLPVPDQQQAVHPQGGVVLQGLEKGGHAPGGDAAFLRRGPGQGTGVGQGREAGLGGRKNADRFRGGIGLENTREKLGRRG